MFFINNKDGFVRINHLGEVLPSTRFVRMAKAFATFKEADNLAKRLNLEPYAVLRSALHAND